VIAELRRVVQRGDDVPGTSSLDAFGNVSGSECRGRRHDYRAD
jgi:hypothetical protein